jgi:hypothetical protein
MWLFVCTVFVNCICSVSLLLKVFILSVVLCLYCLLSYCGKPVICLLSYCCTTATGENPFAVNNNNNNNKISWMPYAPSGSNKNR